MRDLDGLSRFENWIYKILAYFILVTAPAAAIILADEFFLRELSPQLRYPLWIVAAIFGIIVAIGISGETEDGFRALRKFLGRKTLSEIEHEAGEKRLEEAMYVEQWFNSLAEANQRWQIWNRLDKLNETINRAEIQILKTKLWLSWVFILVIAIALKVI